MLCVLQSSTQRGYNIKLWVDIWVSSLAHQFHGIMQATTVSCNYKEWQKLKSASVWRFMFFKVYLWRWETCRTTVSEQNDGFKTEVTITSSRFEYPPLHVRIMQYTNVVLRYVVAIARVAGHRMAACRRGIGRCRTADRRHTADRRRMPDRCRTADRRRTADRCRTVDRRRTTDRRRRAVRRRRAGIDPHQHTPHLLVGRSIDGDSKPAVVETEAVDPLGALQVRALPAAGGTAPGVFLALGGSVLRLRCGAVHPLTSHHLAP